MHSPTFVRIIRHICLIKIFALWFAFFSFVLLISPFFFFFVFFRIAKITRIIDLIHRHFLAYDIDKQTADKTVFLERGTKEYLSQWRLFVLGLIVFLCRVSKLVKFFEISIRFLIYKKKIIIIIWNNLKDEQINNYTSIYSNTRS